MQVISIGWVFSFLILLGSLGTQTAQAEPVGTRFTYQGALDNAGVPANAEYDFEFRLFDTSAAGTQIGAPVLVDDVPVVAGIFTLDLDFGASAFVTEARWLEIALRPGATLDPYTTLAPRQRVAPTPYAINAQFVPAGSITAIEIDPNQVQRRVSPACAVGSYIRSISATGATTCQTDNDGAAALATHAADAAAHQPVIWTAPTANTAFTSRDAISINSSAAEATLFINDAGATGPALLLANATASEGDIAVAEGDVLQIGTWNLGTDTYTNWMQLNGDVGIVNRLGVGTTSPNRTLVVQADDPIVQIRDDTTDNSAAAARLELVERSGGSYDGGGFLQWEGALNRLYIGTLNNGTASNLLVLDRGSQSVGIGTETLDNSYALSVNGSIRSKEIVVESGWSDYVFEPGYRLAPLEEVAAHIQAHGHLPDVPSAASIASDGLPIGQSQAMLMRKIEELTLHLIAMQREIQMLRRQNDADWPVQP